MEHKRIIAKIKNLGLKRFLSRMVGNDRGVVLIFALVLMLVLTIIGSSATMTSQVDLKISGNTKVSRTSFYVADGGIMMSPKVISRIISDRALPSASETPLLAYDDYAAAVGEDPVLLKKIMGFAGTEGVGVGGAASAAIIYNLASRGTVGTSPKTTESDIVAQYRKVAGVAGGR